MRPEWWGNIAPAEALFDESRAHYGAVSPFPLAMLDFQRGRMRMEGGDLHHARTWFSAAFRRVPAYAPAQGHLAEVEDALGEHGVALDRLASLAISSDDPDYAAQLSHVLTESGRTEDARQWRALASARYDILVARHPAAFSDHAAEFWLKIGADPNKALSLAMRNLAVRRTPRARELVSRAARARSVKGARARWTHNA